jgi:hypothetical protein
MKQILAAVAALALFATGFAGGGSTTPVEHSVAWGGDVAQYPGQLERVEVRFAPTSQLDVRLKWFALIPGDPFGVEWNRQWDVSVDAAFRRGSVELAQHDVFQFGSAVGPEWPATDGIDFSYSVPTGAPLVIDDPRTLALFQGRSTVDLTWSVTTSGSQSTLMGQMGPVGYESDALGYTLLVAYYPATN